MAKEKNGDKGYVVHDGALILYMTDAGEVKRALPHVGEFPKLDESILSRPQMIAVVPAQYVVIPKKLRTPPGKRPTLQELADRGKRKK